MKNNKALLVMQVRLNRLLNHKYFLYSKEKVKQHLPYESIPLWLASIATGIVAVLYERLFELVEHWADWIFQQSNYLIFLTAPLFMCSAWFIVYRFNKSSAGSGIPQLMISVELADSKKSKFVDYFLNLKVVIFKVLSSLLLLLGGGAIGREGPTLQIAGSIFQFAYKLVPTTWSKVSQRNMLITGGASGLAAAFNTPLGGIVYVVEELTKSHIGKFRTAVFTAVIISGMTAQLFLGSYLYLGFPKIAKIPLWGILLVIIFAFLSGVAGAAFSKILLLVDIQRKKVSKPKLLFLIALIASMAFAMLVFFTGKYSMGTGKVLMNEILFTNHQMPWFTFPARFLGCILSQAVGAAGGIFATSLASGASFGHLLINLADIPTQYHNLLVLVTMIGFLTGVTRSPFTAAILVLEMTDRHSAIFYFLIAGLVSNLGAATLMKHSFYDYQRIAFAKHIDEIVKASKRKASRA